ncbi:MAG: hypothetical protein AB4352_21615 [Hormoscilla sp.]
MVERDVLLSYRFCIVRLLGFDEVLPSSLLLPAMCCGSWVSSDLKPQFDFDRCKG